MKKVLIMMLLFGTSAWAQPPDQNPQRPPGSNNDMTNAEAGPRTTEQERLKNPELQSDSQEQRLKQNRTSRSDKAPSSTRKSSKNPSSTGVGNTHTDSSTNKKTESEDPEPSRR